MSILQANLVVPSPLEITISSDGIPGLTALATAFFTEMRSRMTDLEQKLTDSVAANKQATRDMELRVIAAEAKTADALTQLTVTNDTLVTTVAALKQQIADGNIGGAGADVVNQAITDLAAETADIAAFQSAAPAVPAGTEPLPAAA